MEWISSGGIDRQRSGAQPTARSTLNNRLKQLNAGKSFARGTIGNPEHPGRYKIQPTLGRWECVERPPF